jgi:hypothetical protein
MAQCIAKTMAGKRCTRTAVEGSLYCAQHPLEGARRRAARKPAARKSASAKRR